MRFNVLKSSLLLSLLINYNSLQAQDTLSHQWMTRIDGSSHYVDMVSDMKTDKFGNSYLTGNSHDSTSPIETLNAHVMTTKIDPNGIVKWKNKRFAQSEFGVFAQRVAIASDGNIICVLKERRNDALQSRIIVQKLKKSDGSVLWENVLTDTTQNVVEEVFDLKTDSTDNIYICGNTTNFSLSSFDDDYLTIKVASNGTILWRRQYNNDAYNDDDKAYNLAIDKDLNVIVTGQSRGMIGGIPTSYDIATIKYSATGDLLWTHRHNGTGYGNDYGMKVITDDDNNIYVSGTTDALSLSTDSSCVIKLTPSGTKLWQFNYLGASLAELTRQPIVRTPSGNIALTFSTGNGITTALINNSGSLVWIKFFNRDNQIALPYNIAVDDTGNIIVTGRTRLNAPTLDDVTTLKYTESGELKWMAFYNGSSTGSMDFGRHIGLDGANNIYIASWTTFDDNNEDYTLLKYGNNLAPVDTSLLVKEEAIIRNTFSVYPNPTKDKCTLHFYNDTPDKIEVIDITGRVIISKNNDAHEKEISLTTEQLTTGQYLIKCTYSNKTTSIQRISVL